MSQYFIEKEKKIMSTL